MGEVLDSLVNISSVEIFKEDGDLLSYVRVLLNGIAISDLNTELKKGDELAVFPPVGGG